MFTPLPRQGNRWSSSLAASFAVHFLLLLLILRGPRAPFVTPSATMAGANGSSTEITYLAIQERAVSVPHKVAAKHRRLRAPVPNATQAREAETPALIAANDQPGQESRESIHAGSPFGFLASGPANGHEVRPALPVVFPEPLISRADIPRDVQGDVVVEVTIDAQGNVIGTKILQSLGYNIEEKVLAAVQNWRFRPATIDNVPIPSQHNVYFHYPR